MIVSIPVEAKQTGQEVRELINVPAKVAAPRAPAPPAPGSPQRPAGAEEEESEEESLEWRRKASSRRLRANRPAGETGDDEPAADYEPEFTALRKADWTPEFDQLAPDTPANPAAPRVRSFDQCWTLLLVGGGIVALMLGFSTVLLLWYRNDIEANRKVAEPSPEKLPDVVQGKIVQATMEAVTEVESVVTRFFAARTPEEKAKVVRGGDALLPVMRSYYARRPDEPGEIHFTRTVTYAGDDGRQFYFIKGTDTYKKPFEVVLEGTAEGMKLDWRYLTGSGEMEWAQWVRERPATPVRLRAVASPDNYYSGVFSNPAEWLCIRISDMAGTVTAWAYAKRDSATAEALMATLAGQRRNLRVQGLFEFPPGEVPAESATALAPQVFIRSFDDRGWLDRSPELGYPAAVSPREEIKTR